MPNLIDSVNHVVVVTGAGFSAPSGMPVYRNGGTGWIDSDGQDMSHASRFGNHLPQLWERWHALAYQAQLAQPNAAHLALARWERILLARPTSGSLTIVTQNIDGLHQRAGSRNVLEVHGAIRHSRRINKCETFGYTPTPNEPLAPQAPNGSRRTRPDIVLFGEQPRHMRAATHAVVDADLVIFAGTSGTVWPVAGLLHVATKARTRTMLLNHDEWSHGDFDVIVLDDVTVLDQLIPSDVQES